MIIGIGNDVIDIRRIEETLTRFGSRFIDRIFTEVEIRKSEKRAQRAASYAKRFAAKEACSKALGTGFRKEVYWRDMGVVNEPSGKPTMVLSGGAKAQLDRLVPAGHAVRIHLTITDDFPYAHAFVMIEALPHP
ncbi:MAG: holo-ACP synthase [Hyphomicrobiales bacterium]|uniref:holo-ACP synthase n=1 Tax=Aestuariivirga sp. TaxID=2650926 RepID=UPI0035B16A2C